MWRRISGVLLLVFGIVILAAELFFTIAFDFYLPINMAFAVFRIVIALVLISLGIKLAKGHNKQEIDEDEEDYWDDTDETNYWQ